MCKTQTSVSHISTEAEIIPLDGSLRMDGIPALTLWYLAIELFHSRTDGPNGEPLKKPVGSCHAKHAQLLPNQAHQRHSNKHWSHSLKYNASCFQCYVARLWGQWGMFQEPTELVWIGCLTRLIWTPKIQIRYIDTKHQLGDMLTKKEFHTWWVEQSSSCVQYQTFQLHLLHQEFQLGRLLHNGEEDTSFFFKKKKLPPSRVHQRWIDLSP